MEAEKGLELVDSEHGSDEGEGKGESEEEEEEEEEEEAEEDEGAMPEDKPARQLAALQLEWTIREAGGECPKNGAQRAAELALPNERRLA